MPVPLRTDFDAKALRTIARATKDGPQARRLLALAAIYDGATRTAAARIGGVTVQIVRGWVGKVNAHGAQGVGGTRYGPGLLDTILSVFSGGVECCRRSEWPGSSMRLGCIKRRS